MSEDPVLLILASSFSMRSVGIWEACQSSKATVQRKQEQQQQQQRDGQKEAHD